MQGQGGMFMWIAIAILMIGVAVAIWLSCSGKSTGRGTKSWGRNPGGGLPGLGSAVKTKPV